MRAGPAGEERRTPQYTVPVSPQCPQEIGLPTLPHTVFQGAAISSEHTSQFIPPRNVAELRCSPPLWGSLITQEASLERLVPLVDFLAAWKLLPNVSRWVLHTVERGYRIQFGSLPLDSTGCIPLCVSGRSVSFPRGTRVTYITWDISLKSYKGSFKQIYMFNNLFAS